MPKILLIEGYSFFFFSNEGKPLKSPHVHIRKAEALAKFWLEPEVILAESHFLNSADLNKLQSLVEQNKKFILEKWNEYFKC